MAVKTKLASMKVHLIALKNGLNSALTQPRELNVSQRALIPVYLYIMLETGGESTDSEIGEKMKKYMPLLPEDCYSDSEVSDGKSRIEKARSFFRTQLDEMGKELQIELITKDTNLLILTKYGINKAEELKPIVMEIINLQKSLLINSSGHSCGTKILINRKK